ncbi:MULTISPECIES: AMP-binding protein [unclassified Herbaspirillum]|uniref:AMP-binding protein n=1 Tax=unclassified Herbaspirillum TaxID=2624150 RepID=UPI0011506A7B|nr:MULTISPECIES: AMP-binding protein [unclassified Herbaspirillum]MBB5390277.1 fatty-acyl-CoA synthase [Herbaspirillum sp. SJZ102]TQK09225.1 fatty-acyl-CoA synthase [Herbaspirillum sp. SJZ130]TQK14088.1 fatty-acyl-CoA synthase [Herbaspirillum sp. SJZ106]TWC69787.1 fatty-acyl-CoA synthase [Herbaspirillum sp. SJZ099]
MPATDLLLTMPALLARNVAERGDAVAFIDGERHITYREFDRMAGRTAAWLQQQGIGPGDRVAVWLVNRMEWLAMYFGLARIGAAMMTVNTRYRSHELAYILERSQACMLVLQLNFRKIDFPAVLRDVPAESARTVKKVVVVDAAGAADGAIPSEVLGKPTVAFDLAGLPHADVPDVSSPDAHSILFTTSGTTSGPKLVLHPQRTVTLHSQRVAPAYGFTEEGVRLLAALPFAGVFGFNATMAAFAAGKPIVVMDTFDGPGAARLIRQHHATHVFGSDEMFRRIIENGEGERPFPSARVFGFACFHPGIVEYTQAAWARGIPMIGLYGSSEVQALFSLQQRALPLEERIKGGGMPASHGLGAEVRIRDIDSGELLPVGRSGAIEIRSDTNFIGYLNNPEATAKAIDGEGFFRTGDVGYLREDGSFVYQTRQGDAMRLGGYLVSPVEIEDVIKTVPGVADVQVVAVDIANQARPVAFVIAAPGSRPAEQEMVRAAAAALAAFKVPARIWLVDEFPTTQSSNGTKIQRVKLRDMALQQLAQTA